MNKAAKIIGLKELRQNTEKYIKAVKRGQSFVVLRRAKPIFNLSPVDEWGDDGVWETVIDFTQIQENGVPIDTVLEALKKRKANG